MAAAANRALVLVFCFTYFCSFGCANRITYGREDLLNYGDGGHGTFRPLDEDTSGFKESLVGATATHCANEV